LMKEARRFSRKTSTSHALFFRLSIRQIMHCLREEHEK
jgi:hypothetical protein